MRHLHPDSVIDSAPQTQVIKACAECGGPWLTAARPSQWLKRRHSTQPTRFTFTNPLHRLLPMPLSGAALNRPPSKSAAPWIPRASLRLRKSGGNALRSTCGGRCCGTVSAVLWPPSRNRRFRLISKSVLRRFRQKTYDGPASSYSCFEIHIFYRQKKLLREDSPAGRSKATREWNHPVIVSQVPHWRAGGGGGHIRSRHPERGP